MILHSWYQTTCRCIDSVDHLLPLSMHVVHLFCVSNKVDDSLNFCHLGMRCTTCMNALRLSNTVLYTTIHVQTLRPKEEHKQLDTVVLCIHGSVWLASLYKHCAYFR